MKLPRFSATTPPPRESGLARATDIGALTRTAERPELGAISKGLSGISETLYKSRLKREALDNKIQMGNATQQAREQANINIVAAKALHVEMDMPDPDDDYYFGTLSANNLAKMDNLLSGSLKERDSVIAKIARGITDPDQRALFMSWAGLDRVALKEDLRKIYGDKLHSYQSSQLEGFRISAARNGDMEAADKWVDIQDEYELITPTKARELKEENKKILAASGAKAILEAGIRTGLDPFEAMNEAYKFVDSVEDLNIDDRFDITKDIEREANLMDFRGSVAQMANRDAELEKGRKIIEEPATATYEEIDKLNLGVGDKEVLKTRLEGAVKHPAPKTSHQVYNKLIGDVLDYADGTISLGDLNNNIAAERFDNFTLSQEDYEDLVGKMCLNLPAAVIMSLKNAKTYGEKFIPTLLRGSREDSKRIAGYNRALLDWVTKNMGEKGFGLNVVDIYTQSCVLATVFRETKEITPETGTKVQRIPGGLPEGEKAVESEIIPEVTKEEYDALPSGAKYKKDGKIWIKE